MWNFSVICCKGITGNLGKFSSRLINILLILQFFRPLAIRANGMTLSVARNSGWLWNLSTIGYTTPHLVSPSSLFLYPCKFNTLFSEYLLIITCSCWNGSPHHSSPQVQIPFYPGCASKSPALIPKYPCLPHVGTLHSLRGDI